MRTCCKHKFMHRMFSTISRSVLLKACLCNPLGGRVVVEWADADVYLVEEMSRGEAQEVSSKASLFV